MDEEVILNMLPKDGGTRTMSISQVEDTKVYQNIAADLLKNPTLVL